MIIQKTDDIVCPHCNHAEKISNTLYMCESNVKQCKVCKKEFRFRTILSISYEYES